MSWLSKKLRQVSKVFTGEWAKDAWDSLSGKNAMARMVDQQTAALQQQQQAAQASAAESARSALLATQDAQAKAVAQADVSSAVPVDTQQATVAIGGDSTAASLGLRKRARQFTWSS